MVIDILILCLLFITFTINLLALGVFCRTPGLRTTAGRFVINLLVINLAGCFILASTLFCIGNISTREQTVDSDYGLKIISRESSSYSIQENFFIFKYNSTYFEKMTIKEMDKQIMAMRGGEKMYFGSDSFVEISDESRKIHSNQFMRLWSIDLAVALGGLSVLVVVGDTWMAVRDPLRYYLRVSKEKAWLLIALNWTLGIVFGVMSACWQIDFKWLITVGKENNAVFEQFQMMGRINNIFFSNTFACIYFIVVILLPFGFVCGMYWKIFSEAKENGLRMRKYTSTFPLQLQLTSSPRNQKHQRRICLENNNLSRKGLHLDIDDDRKILGERVTKAESHREMRPFLKRSSEQLILSDRLEAIRQIYSTPNIQKYYHGDFLIGFETSSNLRYMAHQALRIHNSPISSESISYMDIIRQRLHETSFFNYRKESRAARISILVVMMFLVSYLPYGFLAMLQGNQIITNFPYSTQLAIFMALLANLTSPFIFAYRNKRVRHGVIRLFGFDIPSRNHHLQRKSIFLRFITKISISIKRNSRKLSTHSMSSSLTSVPNCSRESLHNKKYCMSSFEKYLTNSASIQSSTMFGNICVLNAVFDIQADYNLSI